jgi:hypothetical protein
MTRYKGQLRASPIQQQVPHHVDIVIPPGGLGTQLDAMYESGMASSHSAGTASMTPMARSFGGALPTQIRPRLLPMSSHTRHEFP